MVFMKHLEDFTQKREDIKNIEKYHKNGFFEELCHLVEQKGDSSIHPNSYWDLWRFCTNRNLQQYGNEIIARLDTDRNHYEVYLMVMNAYPNDWIERCWRYFTETPETYKQNFEQWKLDAPIDVAYPRLITDTLRSINVLHVAERVPKEKLLDENKRLLDTLIETGELDVEKKMRLIEEYMGSSALSLVDSLDESIFKTDEIFFSTIVNLWKSLHILQDQKR